MGAALLLADAHGVFRSAQPSSYVAGTSKTDARRSLRRACVYLARPHRFRRELSALLAAARGPKSCVAGSL